MAVKVTGKKNLYKILVVGDSPYPVSDDGPNFFILDTTGGDITVNLPTLADNLGRPLHFLKIVAANIATLDGEGAETIDGVTTHIMYRNRRAVDIEARAAEWTMTKGAPKLGCQRVDVTIPKRPVANPPGEGLEDGFPTLDFNDTVDESVFLMWRLSNEYYTSGRVII